MADPMDLRADVLEGIDREIAEVDLVGYKAPHLSTIGFTALRHLREIVERHRMGTGDPWCVECRAPWPCPPLVSLAPDYAPQALKEIGK